MRTAPADDDDREELKRLRAPEWMVELLSANPGYTCWGPGEDYMSTKGDGWSVSKRVETWADFAGWSLDDLNECVHFHFEINRDSRDCSACGQSGYNPETRKIADGFYAHSSPTGSGWNNNITLDELQALIEGNRMWDLYRHFVPGKGWDDTPKPRATQEMLDRVNAANGVGARGFELNHDAINRCILIEARAKRLGVYGHCAECEGHGYVFTAPEARLGLVLWWLHPRKGCSRGIEIRRIERDEVPKARAFLRHAAERNAERFSRL